MNIYNKFLLVETHLGTSCGLSVTVNPALFGCEYCGKVIPHSRRLCGGLINENVGLALACGAFREHTLVAAAKAAAVEALAKRLIFLSQASHFPVTGVSFSCMHRGLGLR